jgi:hypothetical protein
MGRCTRPRTRRRNNIPETRTSRTSRLLIAVALGGYGLYGDIEDLLERKQKRGTQPESIVAAQGPGRAPHSGALSREPQPSILNPIFIVT